MFKSKKRKTLLATTALVVILGGITLALYSGHYADASVPAQAAQPAVPVGINIMREQPVRIWSEFSGRLKAVDYAEIRPEVGGRVMEVRFQDGQIVNAGDILFVIDPSSYEATVAKAQANLNSAATNAVFTKTELGRAESLIKTQAISKSLYDGRVNANRMAQAAVGAAAAELQQARLDLEHAYVKAPITGRVSRAEITVGNLVQTGPGAPVLTAIASNKGIYADFEIDEQTYLQDIRGQVGQAVGTPIPVTMLIQGDANHAYQGQIESFDNRIDTASGTIRARALFANADGSLMPGMTVTIKVANGAQNNALLVPQDAIGIDQSKKFVYVVSNDNKVTYREIDVGKQIEDKRIVTSGLKAGERVIVDGIQHVHPDSVVKATEVADKPTAGGAPL